MYAAYAAVNKRSLSFNVEFVKCLLDNGAKFEKNDGLLSYMFNNPGAQPQNPADQDWSRIEYAKTLIELGADVNSTDKETKITPLITLLGNTNIPDEQKEDLAKTLIEYGASVSAKSKDGRKPVTMITDKKSKLYEILRKTKKINKPAGKPTDKPAIKPADKKP